MPKDPTLRQVVVLAPMPLEMNAIVAAFGLSRASKDAPSTGRVGGSLVTAIHIGMGPSVTRRAINDLLDGAGAVELPIDHIMVAGICGGLDPDLEVGTLVNPAVIIDHASGANYFHSPPGDAPLAGKLVTTEAPTLDIGQSRRFFADGCLGVDMESSAVAEVCGKRGCPWSVYRCIGDRYVDGLLDPRILALTNPDGSGDTEGIGRLLAEEPELVPKLDRLSRETTMAARLAAEAAVVGCAALDSPDSAGA